MTTLTANVEIDDPSRYLKQLCRHFGHKVATTCDDDSGTVSFDECDVAIEVVGDKSLNLAVVAGNAITAERFAGVVQRHLEKFAFRQNLTFDWRAPSS